MITPIKTHYITLSIHHIIHPTATAHHPLHPPAQDQIDHNPDYVALTTSQPISLLDSNNVLHQKRSPLLSTFQLVPDS